jgi:hypothetical protein
MKRRFRDEVKNGVYMHFRSLSHEELTESGEEAGFLTIGSSPGITPSPFSYNEWRALSFCKAAEPAFRLQWRDRVGFTPTSLLPPAWGTSVRISENQK